MAASKDVFEPKTFAANAFAAGAFRGVGAVSVVVPRLTYNLDGPNLTYELIGPETGAYILQ